MRPQTTSKRKDQIGFSKVLTIKEQRKFCSYLSAMVRAEPESVKVQRDVLICELFLSTGLRARELAQLRVQDTPFILGMDVIEVYLGKYKKDRTIPVCRELSKKLCYYIEKVRTKTLPRHVRRSDYGKAVFYSQSKHPYTQQVHVFIKKTGEWVWRVRGSTPLYRKVRRIGQRAGIAKHVYPHLLRHTFAVNALSNRVDINQLQQLMGHSDITMTARYLHIVNSQLEGLGRKLYTPFFEFKQQHFTG